LPPELIAQEGLARRDGSRLMILHRRSGRIEHRIFHEIGQYLRSGDCLVLNDTQVIPARLILRKRTGGRVEGLFLKQVQRGLWQVMLNRPGRLAEGTALVSTRENVELTVDRRLPDGTWLLRVGQANAMTLLEQIGSTPLPPYIQRNKQQDPREAVDRKRYQTVYARKVGALAAPTAGLHFTQRLLAELADQGVRRATVTLHVGTGTFRPIRTEHVEQHPIHSEWFQIDEQALATIESTRRAGGRTVAVGTTSARVLESAARSGALTSQRGWTDLFIYPPYRFRLTDALITNFHLPRSTLLAMVMAFASRELILNAYNEAIKKRYRFYSYGDAMLIL